MTTFQTSQTKMHSKNELFEFQNWDVYRKSLTLNIHLFSIAKQLSKQSEAKLADQVRRAGASIPLNIAEGVSRYSLKEKINYWRIAKGSLFECVAILDLIRAFTFKVDVSVRSKDLQKDMSDIGRMLSGLIRWAEEKKINSNE